MKKIKNPPTHPQPSTKDFIALKKRKLNMIFTGKRGMEMWQLVMIVLALILLLAILAWYGILGGELKNLSGGLSNLF